MGATRAHADLHYWEASVQNRDLTTMLNRLCHSEIYRFALKLKTAIAKVLHGSSNLLSTQTVVNSAAIAQEMQRVLKPSVPPRQL